MSNQEQNINIKVETLDANNHLFTVIGTIVGAGGLAAIAWVISARGMLDLAATALTMFGFQLVSLMSKVGMIEMPKNKDGAFKETSSTITTALREFNDWQARSPIWRLAVLALAYTMGFLLLRWGLSQALGVMKDPWIAGGVAALVVAVVVSPRWLPNLLRQFGPGVKVRTKPDTTATVGDDQ